MTLRAFLIGTLTALAVVSCGGGGGNLAGGIGGTGVSSGPATAFGSVIVNGVEYNTDSANIKIEGASVGVGSIAQQHLAIGMMVSVTHDASTNAKSVSFQDNAEGPVANIAITDSTTGTGTFTVLGLTVTVNNLTVFGNTSGLIGTSALSTADIVEVSGQLTGSNAILATRVERKSAACGTAGLHIEVKGTASNVNHTGSGSFDIVSTGTTLHVNANGHMPSGLTENDYVEVSSTACPSAGTLITSVIDSTVSEGPDLSDLDHPGEGELEIKGIVSDKAAATQGCLFSVNGLQVSATTLLCVKVSNGGLVEVHGQINGGVFVASEISNENIDENSTTELKGLVTAVSPTGGSAFEGSITLGANGTFTTDVNTRFESDTPPFNLNTITPNTTCVEIKTNNSDVVLSIEEKTSDCP